MTILDYHPALEETFAELFVEYCRELDDSLTESLVRRKILPLFLDEWNRKILHIALVQDAQAAGLSVFQIDTPESDWCKRPGWGCIREFYIRPAARHRGLGKALAEYSERCLRTLGASALYLTADDAVAFWERCGYAASGEICSNDLEVFVKSFI